MGAFRAATSSEEAIGGISRSACRRWDEELEGDAVGVTEGQAGPVGRVLDVAVGDAQLVERRDHFSSSRVGAPEGDVVEADAELAEARHRGRLLMLVQAEQRAVAQQVDRVVEGGVGVLVEHRLGVEQRLVQGTLTVRSRTVSATWVSGGKVDMVGISLECVVASDHRPIRENDHDHPTESPGRDTRMHAMTDPVDSTLGQLRLDGALFFRGELSDPFEFESSPLTLADALVPGADRLTLFHIVASGSCWIAVDDGVRYWAEAGDVIVMPYADHYVMGGAGTAERVSILALLEPLPWSTMPMLRHGGGGRRTEVVCGYLHSLDPLFDPAMRALPPVFVVHLTDGPAARWVRASIDYALADAAVPTNLSPSPLATRLPELLLSEVLRTHLATAPAIDHGWIAVLHDPLLAPALAALHADPAAPWTVAGLAAAVGASRSSVDDRFRQVLGQSPIRYLTAWRMHLATDLLATTELSVFTIARRVGYDAEEAFSRASSASVASRRATRRAAMRRERRHLRRPSDAIWSLSVSTSTWFTSQMPGPGSATTHQPLRQPLAPLPLTNGEPGGLSHCLRSLPLM